MKKLFFVLVFTCSFTFVSYSQDELPDKIKTEVHGDAQFDGRFFSEEMSNTINTFHIRRARVHFDGSYLKDFSFRIRSNFSNSRLELQDAYIEFKSLSFARLRGGKFKSPFGLERLQSTLSNSFVELGLTSNLVPNRDIGMMLTGNIADGIINYSAGVFNGVIDGESSETDNSNEKDLVGRIFLHPFKSSDISMLQGLGLGIAASNQTQIGLTTAPMLPSYRTSGRQTFFRYLSNGSDSNTVVANGKHMRLCPQAYLYAGRLGLLTEYVFTEQGVKKLNVSSDLKNSSWQAIVTFLLTDDKASYNGVKPKNNFDPAQNKWGAIELAFRYNKLSIDKDAFPIFASPQRSAYEASAWAVGFNWYFNQYFRFTINYESTSFKNLSTVSLPDENLILTRIQVGF